MSKINASAAPTTEVPKGHLSDAFHNHLDTCKRCHDNPFDLCALGTFILTGEMKVEQRPLPAEVIQAAGVESVALSIFPDLSNPRSIGSFFEDLMRKAEERETA